MTSPGRRLALCRQTVKALTGADFVQVVDPAEETLPYAGRVEFQDMAGPLKFLSSKIAGKQNETVPTCS